MPTTTHRKKAVPSPKAQKRSHKLKKLAPRKAASKPIGPLAASKLREKLGLTQPEFAVLLPASVRSVATLEQGDPPTVTVARRLAELDRLTKALGEVIRAESIGKWLKTPNPAFDGLKPLEVVERGEGDRLWEMIYFLRSGVAS